MKKAKLKKLFNGQQASFFPIYLMDLAATHSIKSILKTSCRKIYLATCLTFSFKY